MRRRGKGRGQGEGVLEGVRGKRQGKEGERGKGRKSDKVPSLSFTLTASSGRVRLTTPRYEREKEKNERKNYSDGKCPNEFLKYIYITKQNCLSSILKVNACLPTNAHGTLQLPMFDCKQRHRS